MAQMSKICSYLNARPDPGISRWDPDPHYKWVDRDDEPFHSSRFIMSFQSTG